MKYFPGRKTFSLLILISFLLVSSIVKADEGMWTFDNLPLDVLKEKYGFNPSQKWIESAYKATIRFNSGASGAFVSPNGLVITNHHVAMSDIQKLSTPKKDYVKNGFYARRNIPPLKCPDLELNVLDSIEDVTDKVLKAANIELSEAEQNKLKKAEMARIEKSSFDKTGLRSNVVELYNGGQYHLYRYKKYTDIRLVMAPEMQPAHFGGEYDNYSYPRYQFDYAFFRVYEKGKPIRSKHYFKWNPKGAKKDELVFVTGNPSQTDRLKTTAQLEYDRDYYIPSLLDMLYYFRKAFREYADKGPEQKRQSHRTNYSIGNYIKRYEGMSEALLNEKMFSKKIEEEKEFRDKIKKNKNLKKLNSTWKNIEKVQKKLIKLHPDLVFHGVYDRIDPARYSDLLRIANTIVRYSEEIQKPNNERFKEYRDSNLDSLHHRLYSPAPIYPDKEQHALTYIFKYLIEKLGKDDEYVKELFSANPEILAKTLAQNTRIYDPKFRKELVKGGKKAIEKSTDPMIMLAKRTDHFYRKTRKKYEDNIESIEKIESTKLAKARFAVYGKKVYPDATFTPRLTFGAPRGYELNTTLVPQQTTFYGLFARNAEFDNKHPFDLTGKFMRAKRRIRMQTPVNQVLTTDTIAGNSGSPVFNKNLEYVGLVFDRNIHGLSRSYLYDETQGRTISVHSGGITETLKNVYGMKNLVRELTIR